LGTYGWQVQYQIPQQPENQFKQSNTWNVAPVLLGHNGVALSPAVTPTTTLTDPYGNTNSPNIQQVVFNLNGGSTTGDNSYVLQPFTPLPNPHTMHMQVWLSSASGTSTILWGNISGSPQTALYTIPAYPAWKLLSLDQTINSTADNWELIGEGSLTSPSATLYVYSACLTRNSGACVSTTGTPATTTATVIDQTSNAPLLAAPGTVFPTNGANAFTGTQTAPQFNLQSGAAGPYSQFFDDFYTAANITSNPVGSAVSSSCGQAPTNVDINHPGNIRVNAGTGANGTGAACYSAGSPSIFSINTSLPWVWESAVIVPVLESTTAGSYQAGMVNNPLVSPWTTGVGFYLSSTNGVPGDWYCEYASTTIDSTVAATTSWVRLTVTNDGVNFHFYINGTERCGTGIAIANLPSTSQYVFAYTSVNQASPTQVLMSVDYVTHQRAVVR
jgi:hypothetical protein